MKTILKLGFAMGGGVSLGSFCGAALTEVIKLSLLEIAAAWQAGETPAFDEVEVDVFSGASAGCLSLALMLRALAHQTPNELHHAHTALSQDPRHGPLFAWLTQLSQQPDDAGIRARHLVDQLLAAQSAQQLQDEAWVQRIDIRNLLPNEQQVPTLATQPGLLNFDAVRDIARDLLLDRPARETPNPDELYRNPQILGPRVLFAATLSNVTPILHDARPEFSSGADSAPGLTDGLRSNVHRELRVFDLNFRNLTDSAATLDKRRNEHHPYRWILIHRGNPPAGAPAGDVLDLRDRATWSMIATTAMASGAVPFAFPPVVLDRWDYEFGYDRDLPPSQQAGCTWPSPLRDPSSPSHPFTYVDGGTFNNEPIREAFRLASFIDSRSTNPEIAVHRRIVFVDPFVSHEQPSLAVGLHHLVASGDKRKGEPEAGSHPEKRAPFDCATLDRLVPHLGQLLGAILDEARVVEGDKVFQTRHRFQLRTHILDTISLVRLTPTDPADRKALETVATRIVEACSRQLESDFLSHMVPTGNLNLPDELRRVLHDRASEFTGLDPTQANAFCDSPASVGKDFGRWLKVLLHAYVDILMDLGGKSDRARLLAVSPQKRPQLLHGTLVSEPLPLGGAGLGGFAGFMDESTRRGDFGAGRFCAGLFLTRESFPPLPDQPTDVPRPETLRFCLSHTLPQEELQIRAIPGDILKSGLERLARRTLRAVKQARLVQVFPGLDQVIELAIGNFLAGQIKNLQADVPEKRAFELWINVEAMPNPTDLELDGKGMLSDYPARRHPARPGLWLITTADCHFGSATQGTPRLPWKGYHLDEPAPFADPCLPIYRNSLLSLADRKICDLLLPNGDLLQRALATGAVGFLCSLTPVPSGSGPITPRWAPFYPTPDVL